MRNLVKTKELSPKGKVLKAFILNEERKRQERKLKFKKPFEAMDIRMKKVNETIEQIRKILKK